MKAPLLEGQQVEFIGQEVNLSGQRCELLWACGCSGCCGVVLMVWLFWCCNFEELVSFSGDCRNDQS